jgi:hypothetical protein
MSEKELREEKASKTIVGSTFVLLVALVLLLSSCSSSSYTSCAAYASVEVKNEMK